MHYDDASLSAWSRPKNVACTQQLHPGEQLVVADLEGPDGVIYLQIGLCEVPNLNRTPALKSYWTGVETHSFGAQTHENSTQAIATDPSSCSRGECEFSARLADCNEATQQRGARILY